MNTQLREAILSETYEDMKSMGLTRVHFSYAATCEEVGYQYNDTTNSEDVEISCTKQRYANPIPESLLEEDQNLCYRYWNKTI